MISVRELFISTQIDTLSANLLFSHQKKLMTMYLRVNFKISFENLFQQKFGAILMLKILFIEIPSTVFWAEESKMNAWLNTNLQTRFRAFLSYLHFQQRTSWLGVQPRSVQKEFFLHCERFLRLVRNDHRKLKD